MKMLLKLAWLEGKLLVREPVTLVFTLGLPIVMELVMGGVFGNSADPDFYRGVGAMDYYLPAYVGIVVAALGLITLPTHIATYRERGVLRRFEASSIPRRTIIGAHSIVMIGLAAIGAILVVIVGVIAYDPALAHSWVEVAIAYLISVLAFAAIGTLLGLAVATARAAQGIGIMLWFVMFMVGGAGPPPEVLGSVMNAVGSATPLKHVILMIQDPWLGFGWNWTETGIVAGFGVACLGLAALASRRISAR
jgi:ABC-2 type transport system permease protein